VTGLKNMRNWTAAAVMGGATLGAAGRLFAPESVYGAVVMGAMIGLVVAVAYTD
jgi:hypothetical protein